VAKRYLMYVAGRNLGVMMRALFGMGTPKSLQTEGETSPCAVLGWFPLLGERLRRLWTDTATYLTGNSNPFAPGRVNWAA